MPKENDSYLYIKRPEQLGSVYHLIGADGETSICGRAHIDKDGYVKVYRDKPVFRSLRCANCATERVVSKGK
jgi:hypothetical protein